MKYFLIPVSKRAKEFAAVTYVPPRKGNRIIKEDHYEFRERHSGAEYFRGLTPPMREEEFKEIQFTEE